MAQYETNFESFISVLNGLPKLQKPSQTTVPLRATEAVNERYCIGRIEYLSVCPLYMTFCATFVSNNTHDMT
jgi:hypothetical protein